MNTRPYGSTGKRVSEVGFGAWQLGNSHDWEAMSDAEAIKLVHEAMDRGMNFFDTAPYYGFGASEELLGQALRGRRSEVVINTKFGHGADGVTDFSASGIRQSVEQSLKRLQTDYLDSILIHNPPFDHLDGKYGHYEVFEELKKEGKLLAYGASVDSRAEMLEVISKTGVGIIEVMFNIMYQETAETFKLAQENNIGLIIKVPLDSGWLSGKYNRDSTFEGVRKRWSPETIAKRGVIVERIRSIIGEETPMPVAALRFILAYPEVATVIPGVRSVQQLIENMSAGEEVLPSDQVQQLQQLWSTDIQFQQLGW